MNQRTTIKNEKPKTAFQPIRKYLTSPELWAKSDNGKADPFLECLTKVSSPHDNDQELTTPILEEDSIKAFTRKEIEVNKSVKPKEG